MTIYVKKKVFISHNFHDCQSYSSSLAGRTFTEPIKHDSGSPKGRRIRMLPLLFKVHSHILLALPP